MKEEDFHTVTDERVNDKDFQNWGTEIEAYESIEDLKFPQDYEDGGKINLDDLIKKELKDQRVQAMFKRPRDKNLSIFLTSQYYYELPKRMIRASGNNYHIFKPNNFGDVQKLYQDKASMDMTLDEYKDLTSTCRNEKYQPLTTDMNKNKYIGQYRLGMDSLFVPQNNPL